MQLVRNAFQGISKKITGEFMYYKFTIKEIIGEYEHTTMHIVTADSIKDATHKAHNFMEDLYGEDTYFNHGG